MITKMTHAELETLLDIPVLDWQWERMEVFLNKLQNMEPCTIVDCPRLKKEIWWEQ